MTKLEKIKLRLKETYSCNLNMFQLKRREHIWWRWVESNYRSIGYEPIALTAEPHRQDYRLIIYEKIPNVKVFLKFF